MKKDVQLSSISGGTDIGCFALGNPIEPVKGLLQSISLGYDVKAFDEHQQPCFHKRVS